MYFPKILLNKVNKLLKPFLLTIPIGVTLIDCIGYVVRVDGTSMQPTLNPDSTQSDFVFISTWALRTIKVKRGDIVAYKQPSDPNINLIKRIVGIDGDIMVSLGRNNNSDYYEIPSGHCWIEGDNEFNTFDNSSYGVVAIGLITGKAVYIVWPPHRWRNLKKDTPNKNGNSPYKLMI